MTTRILAAVSGGADSMCMLGKLLDGRNEIIVAHFNHKMREGEADRDARFVKEYCDSKSLKCIIGEASETLHSEEEARTARYDFLNKTAEENDCLLIATAHTKNDNAETMLLNLARGTGLKGLCGIPQRRGNIIRPILDMTRKDVEEYLERNNIPHIEDSSNDSDDYARNIIRHKIIPVLEDINPNAVEAFFRTSQLLKDDEDFLSKVPYCEHRAIASRFIRKNCPKPLTYDQVEAVLNLGEGYKQIDLPGITVIKDRGKLYFEELKPEYDVSIQEDIVNKELTNDYIRYDSIIGELRVTHREPGDKYRIAGRNCTKTLKSLFIEHDLTQAERDNWPIVRDDFGIVWVYKFGVAERVACRIGDRAYRISVMEREKNAQRL